MVQARFVGAKVSDDDENPDLGIQDARTRDSEASSDPSQPRPSHDTQATTDTMDSTESGGGGSKNPVKAYKGYKDRSRDLHRRHRGLMQWRPMRNAQFAKDEVKYMARKVKNLGALDGRKPDVETEV